MSSGGDNEVEETAAERALSEVAVKSYNTWRETFKPLEDRYIQSVTGPGGLNSAEQHRDVRGLATQATAAPAQRVMQTVRQQTQQRGVNPNSGAAKLAVQSAGLKTAADAGDTIARSSISQQDRYAAGLENIVAIGQGQEANAQAGMGDLAVNAGAKAISDAQTDWNDRQATGNFVGTMAGLGTAAYMGAGKKPVTAPDRTIEDYGSADLNGMQDPFLQLHT